MPDNKTHRSDFLKALVARVKQRFKERNDRIQQLENQNAALRQRNKELMSELEEKSAELRELERFRDESGR